VSRQALVSLDFDRHFARPQRKPYAPSPLIPSTWVLRLAFLPSSTHPNQRINCWLEEKEFYILAQSRQRLSKERAIRRRRLKKLWHRPAELRQMRPESRPASDQAWPSQRRSRPAGFIHIPARVKAFVLSVNSVAFGALETFKKVICRTQCARAGTIADHLDTCIGIMFEVSTVRLNASQP